MMSVRTRLYLLGLLAFWFSSVPPALAFYDPGLGRWITRDSLPDPGFGLLAGWVVAGPSANTVEEGPMSNLYRFVLNIEHWEIVRTVTCVCVEKPKCPPPPGGIIDRNAPPGLRPWAGER
jgi:hypothetical protein